MKAPPCPGKDPVSGVPLQRNSSLFPGPCQGAIRRWLNRCRPRSRFIFH